jgi:hypothetical protein
LIEERVSSLTEETPGSIKHRTTISRHITKAVGPETPERLNHLGTHGPEAQLSSQVDHTTQAAKDVRAVA